MPELLFAIVTISLKILKNGLLSHVYILEQIDLSKSFTFLRLCLRKLYDKEILKIVYKSIKHYSINVYPEKSVTFNIPCHCKLYTRQNSGDKYFDCKRWLVISKIDKWYIHITAGRLYFNAEIRMKILGYIF